MYFFLFCSLQTVAFRQNTSYKIFIKHKKVFLYFALQLRISRKFCRVKKNKITGILFYNYRDILTLFLVATHKKLIKQQQHRRELQILLFIFLPLEDPSKRKLQFHQLYLEK
jgi:hypothetical protein